ncbi:MAG: Toxin YhaV [Pseudomonadota bacterium]|jgi:toxin YhaV
MLTNGWTLYAHPEFLRQLEAMLVRAIEDRRRNPEAWTSRNAFKRLAAVARLAFQAIPADPAGAQWRQGNTLGEAHRHWCRAKFFQQYRLFFPLRQRGAADPAGLGGRR